MNAFSRTAGAVLCVVMGCSVGFAQNGETKDEHDKQIKADTERNTKYHNNADDYPKNTSSAPNVPTPPARIPVTPKPELAVDPIRAANDARIEAARPGMEATVREERKLANAGDVNAISDLARHYSTGYGVAPNGEKAFELYSSIADRDDEAAYEVADRTWEGHGTPKNEAATYPMMRRAAAMGNKKAEAWLKYHPEPVRRADDFPTMVQFAQDVFMQDGVGATPTTEAESARLLTLLSKRKKDGSRDYKVIDKNSKAGFEAARGNLYGIGVPVDPVRAAALFEYAQSIHDGEYYQFWCYWLDTPGHPRDLHAMSESIKFSPYHAALYNAITGNAGEARRWLGYLIDYSHNSSDTQALVDLGVMEMEGKGGDKNEVSGMARLNAAVAKGNKNAQYVLGVIYEKGMHGVAKDPVRAAQLLQAAANAGQADAAKHLTQVGMAK